ncbi:MAG: hypothetical protein Kow0062_12920 [Acidobacteriota bacterium]|nr:MAG: hypothetical protein D6738_12410 [Acidobacteriota bacterium]
MTPEIGRWEHDDAQLAAVRRGGGPSVRVYRVDGPVVVLGSGSDPAVEVRSGICLADGVPIVRRRGGGCAVVLDPGNVVVSIALPVAGLGGIHSHFRWISAWIAAELEELGIRGVRREGVSDLALDGRKIGGSCIHRAKDLLHYGLTLLADADVALIERYLPHPPREPDYRAGRPHRAFVRPLAEHPGGWTAIRLEEDLRARLTPARLLAFPRPPDRMPPRGKGGLSPAPRP